MKRKPVAFSVKMKRLRKAAGLSAYELAKRAGVSRQALSMLESGKNQPSWDTVCRLADAMGVSTEAFRGKA